MARRSTPPTPTAAPRCTWPRAPCKIETVSRLLAGGADAGLADARGKQAFHLAEEAAAAARAAGDAAAAERRGACLAALFEHSSARIASSNARADALEAGAEARP